MSPRGKKYGEKIGKGAPNRSEGILLNERDIYFRVAGQNELPGIVSICAL